MGSNCTGNNRLKLSYCLNQRLNDLNMSILHVSLSLLALKVTKQLKQVRTKVITRKHGPSLNKILSPVVSV